MSSSDYGPRDASGRFIKRTPKEKVAAHVANLNAQHPDPKRQLDLPAWLAIIAAIVCMMAVVGWRFYSPIL